MRIGRVLCIGVEIILAIVRLNSILARSSSRSTHWATIEEVALMFMTSKIVSRASCDPASPKVRLLDRLRQSYAFSNLQSAVNRAEFG